MTKLLLDGDDVIFDAFWSAGNIATLPVFISFGNPGGPQKGVCPAPPGDGATYFLSTGGWVALSGLAKNYFNLTPSAVGTDTPALDSAKRDSLMDVTPGNGAGTYTRIIVLATAGRTDGDVMELFVKMPANANPTIDVRNATLGGTALLLYVPDAGLVRYYYARLWFSGGAWAVKFKEEIV